MPETPRTSRSRGAPPQRVVVADDDIDIRELIALMLRGRGFEVVVTSDGDAALAAILSDGADGFVSDFQMPGLDGLTLCRVLRGLRAYIALPIVMFTGVGEEDPRLLPLRQMNAIRVLHKPMGLRAILPALIEMMPRTLTNFGAVRNAPTGTSDVRADEFFADRALLLPTQ